MKFIRCAIPAFLLATVLCTLLYGSVLAHPNIAHKSTQARFTPPRSVAVTVLNRTTLTWRLSDFGLSAGQWVSSESPPAVLSPFGSIIFASESSHRFSGTSGAVHYTTLITGVGIPKPRTADLNISWYNPYIGYNGFSATAAGFIVTNSSISGNHANITVWICPLSRSC
jgi:hypothetical protein